MEGVDKKNKLTFLQAKALDQSPTYNKRVLAELEASIAGFSIDEVKRMLDTKDDGNAELMSEAARDIKRIISGEDVRPNEGANTAYQQKILDYCRDEQDNIKPEIARKLFDYIDALTPIVMRNMEKNVNTTLSAEGLPTMPGLAQGFGGQAMVPGAPVPPAAPPTAPPPNGVPAVGL